MTRLLTTGFETGDNSDFYIYSPSTPSIITSPVRTGSYAVSSTGLTYGRFKQFTGTDVLYGHTGIRFPYGGYGIPLEGIQFLDSSGTVLITICQDSPGYRISAYLGNKSSLLAKSTSDFAINTWYGMEFYIYIADSGGRAVIKMDGAIWIDYTGDTKVSTTTDIAYMQLCSNSGVFQYYDDIVLNDDSGSDNNTYPGQVKLLPFRPDGAGDNTGLTPSTGSNYQCVDEVPASATDYVYDTVIDDYDLYTTANPTIPDGATITNVIVIAHSAYDSGGGSIAPIMKSGSIIASGIDFALSSAYRPYEYCRSKDPNGDIEWTVSGINSLQIGEKVR